MPKKTNYFVFCTLSLLGLSMLNLLLASSSLAFKPPGKSQPNYTVGAAIRNSSSGLCDRDKTYPNRSLTALVSSAEESTTWEERPTFLVYLPATSAQQAYLIVKDESEDYFYQKNLSLPAGNGGIVSINLPDDTPALQVGKEYTWSVVIACGGVVKPDDPYVSAKITRKEKPDLLGKLTANQLSERVALYEKELIWYDAAATVAKLKQEQPENDRITATWDKLLESIGLKDLANEPLKSIH